MSRSFHEDDLVQLPVVTASSVIALGTQLVTVASAEPELPQGVGRALDKVEKTQEDLQSAVARQLFAAADERQRQADVVLDKSWSAVQLLCLSYAKLSSAPEATRAARVLVRVFPDGLRFTQLPYTSEWA